MMLQADEAKPVLQLDFGQEESAPLFAVGNAVRDQAGPPFQRLHQLPVAPTGGPVGLPTEDRFGGLTE